MLDRMGVEYPVSESITQEFRQRGDPVYEGSGNRRNGFRRRGGST
jgi:hypothetical protein